MTNREFIAQNKSGKQRIKVLKVMGLLTTPQDAKELNLWDKRRWLILVDLWMGRQSDEEARYKLVKVTNEQREARRAKA